MRLSFTGEAAWELHHPVDRSVELWRALMDAGARPRDPAARPPGAVRAAAREGPRHRRHGHRARHDAAPDRHGLGGPDGQAVRSSAGRRSSGRRSSPDDRRWVGFAMDGPAPAEGTPIFDADGGEIIGNVTGSWTSPLLGKALHARLAAASAASPTASTIDGREAVVTPTPFYDPEGLVPAPEPLPRRPRRRRPGALDRRAGRRARAASRAHFASGRGVPVVGASGGRRRRPRRHRRARGRASSRPIVDRGGRGAPHRVAAPAERPAFAQGAIAGVPARRSLVCADGRAWIITHGRLRRRAGRTAGCAMSEYTETPAADPLGGRAEAAPTTS